MSNTSWKRFWQDSLCRKIPAEGVIMPTYIFKNSKRGGYFYGWYHDVNGKQRQFSCHTKDKRQAERYYHQRVIELLQEVRESKENSTTLASFSSNFLGFTTAANPSFSPSTTKAFEYAFRMFINYAGNRPLREYGVEDCQKFIYSYPASVFTKRKLYAHLRSAFQYALEWEKIEVNPFAKFKKPREIESHHDTLDTREFEFFLSNLPERTFSERRWKRLYIVAFETGLRLSEVLNLECDNLYEDQDLLMIKNTVEWTTKGKRNRLLKLCARAKGALLEQKLENSQLFGRQSPWFFVSINGERIRKDTISREFKKAIRKAFPTKNIRFHDLRHSFGTRVGTSPGVSQVELQYYMGHSTPGMTARYIHPKEGYFPTVINALQ